MNKMTRTAMAGALAVALSLGAAAAPAVAAPKAAHAKVAHKHGKAAKAERLRPAERLLHARSRASPRTSDASRRPTRSSVSTTRSRRLRWRTSSVTVSSSRSFKADVRDVKGKVVRGEPGPSGPRSTTRSSTSSAGLEGLEKALADVSVAGAETQAETLAGLVELLMTYDAETKRAELEGGPEVLPRSREHSRSSRTARVPTRAPTRRRRGRADEGADEGAETTQP